MRAVSIWAMVSLISGCGGSQATAPGSGPSSLDLDGWTGAPPASGAETPPPVPTEIALARGETFRSLLALTSTAIPEDGTHCSVYSIRMTTAGLEEGRHAVECPADGLSSMNVDAVRFHEVEEQRSAHLHAALAGAAADPLDDQASQGDRVRVRVVTDQRQLEADVPQPRWPTPYTEQTEAPRGSPPTNLTELWEALMFPHRYAATPVVATAN